MDCENYPVGTVALLTFIDTDDSGQTVQLHAQRIEMGGILYWEASADCETWMLVHDSEVEAVKVCPPDPLLAGKGRARKPALTGL